MSKEVKVEIGQYKEVNKDCLKAFFSVLIHPYGLKVLDCKYFVKGDDSWFAFPQKEVKYNDGRKSDYIPYLSVANKEYLAKLKEVIINAVKERAENGTDKQATISSETPFVW